MDRLRASVAFAVAALAPVQGRVALVVMDVDARKPRVAVRADRADVNWFAWISDDRLVATAIDLQAGIDDLRGAGLHAVDHDGKDLVALGGAFFAALAWVRATAATP